MLQSLDADQKTFHQALQSLVRRDWPLSSVREVADGRATPPASLIDRIAEMGAFAACVPEDLGGGALTDDPISDAAIAAELKGAHLQPWPCASVHAAAVLLASAGSPAQLEGLADLAAGERLSAVPVSGDTLSGDATLAVTRRDGGLLVRGCLLTDLDQPGARLVAVLSLDGDPIVLHLPTDGAGVSRTAMTTFDPSAPLLRISYDDVACPADDVVAADAQQITTAGAVAVILACVESVAAMETLFGMTRDYALDRTAFGRPIGSFQALKHLMADTSMRIEAAKAACWAALRAQRNREPALAEIAGIAKVFVAEQSAQVVQDCLQVHGGIGYAWEHDLHLYLRRIMAGTKLFGDAAHHRGLLARAHRGELVA